MDRYETLTKKEKEVLGFIVLGLNVEQIAKKLFVSKNTIKTHLTRIYQKYFIDSNNGANNRLRLVLSRFEELGMIQLPDKNR